MAIHDSGRERVNVTTYEAMRLIENGLRAPQGGLVPTVDFGVEAVVLKSASRIDLSCRGVSWSVERRDGERVVSTEHLAAVDFRGRYDWAAKQLAARFGAEVVSGPVPIPRSGGTYCGAEIASLPAEPISGIRGERRPAVFRSDLLKELGRLTKRRSDIEEENRALAEDKAAKQRAMRQAEQDFLEQQTAAAGDALQKREADYRLALLLANAKTRPIPAELLAELERVRAAIAQLDGSKLAFLTGVQSLGMLDGVTLESFEELAQKMAQGVPPGVTGWQWRSRREVPLAGDYTRQRLPQRGPDTGHCAFAYDVAGVVDPRDLFALLFARSVAYRTVTGWRVVVALSRPVTDDELGALVTKLEIGTTEYVTTGQIPMAGTSLLNLDNVAPVDVDAVLASQKAERSAR